MNRLFKKSVVLVLVVIALVMVFAPLAAQAAPEDVPRVFSVPISPIILVK